MMTLAELKRTPSPPTSVESATDEVLLGEWTLFAGPHKILSELRYRVLRNLVRHHLIHHRPQLTAYMRLNDIPLSGPYGPSTDQRYRRSQAALSLPSQNHEFWHAGN